MRFGCSNRQDKIESNQRADPRPAPDAAPLRFAERVKRDVRPLARSSTEARNQ